MSNDSMSKAGMSSDDSPSMYRTYRGGGARHMSQYSYVYEEIEWNWSPSSVVEMDKWRAPTGIAGGGGGGGGMMFLRSAITPFIRPRIGQEVIVDFLEGDPDRPLITGRVKVHFHWDRTGERVLRPTYGADVARGRENFPMIWVDRRTASGGGGGGGGAAYCVQYRESDFNFIARLMDDRRWRGLSAGGVANQVGPSGEQSGSQFMSASSIRRVRGGSGLSGVKVFDKSSPKLYQALCTGRPSTPTLPRMEEVMFNYVKIKWTWEIDGIPSEDSWLVPK